MSCAVSFSIFTARPSAAAKVAVRSAKERFLSRSERRQFVYVLLISLVGCSPSSDRHSLTGTVTLDGEPLSQGSIVFFPQPGTPGPSAGGHIVDGRFSIAPEGGTMAGTFRVEITASRKTGRQIVDPTLKMMNPDAESAMIDQTEQYIPPRYNKQSELTAEVRKSGSNNFEFELMSQ